ncbi:Acetoacetate decarboxylase [Candidatus Desulfarcum epimagneticum]|uniref:Acetoacetate decarboxylase n=1 Tax=uncultured Desulfobacteraceae bacterium TaxID=218296 RepID=A0A484HMN0_9BACT|nr:Acetoacetate decarboxylase [uncultured Desulfobacteraceae bacterium]
MRKTHEAFFEGTRPGKTVTHGQASFELPILYYRDDLFGLYFSADEGKVREVMPSHELRPVLLPNGRAIAAIFAFHYMETSIGPYGEVAVGIPAVYGKRITPLTGAAPALLESAFPGFGVLVSHLPVTTLQARDAGRGEWGYPKFTADMDFEIAPEFMSCDLGENGERILELKVMKRGFHARDSRPLTTYSVKDRNLIKTVIPQRAVKRISLFPRGSFVRLGDHPAARSIRGLDLSEKPFMSVYYPERAGILPPGEVIETGVRPLEGYMGGSREGGLSVSHGALFETAE